ncbi:unnamed protein product, partial [Closterium sp. Naga37s-1]
PISGPEEARYVLQNTRRAHSFYGASSMEARPSSISTLLLLPLPIPVCTPPGPISGPQEARYILQNTRGVHGFYGASSMERLPVGNCNHGEPQGIQGHSPVFLSRV